MTESESMSPWNRLISGLGPAHFLQTSQWARVKAKYGWTPLYLVWDAASYRVYPSDPTDPLNGPGGGKWKAACLVLKRAALPRPLAAPCILYAPKGPLLDWSDEALVRRVLDDLQAFARRRGAIFLKIDPDVVLASGLPNSAEERPNEAGAAVMAALQQRGWRLSGDQIQFRNTVWLDLSGSEAELLGRMKQKTRYNLGLAQKKGVRVRAGTLADLPLLYKMYAETSVRDGFVIRPEGYYRNVWELFMQSAEPGAEPLIAEVDGEAVAALFLFWFGERAYYVYGMSRAAHREKMPNYLLQWEAVRRARARGLRLYDLWGAPDVFDEADPLWGVFRFKEGLGGQVVCTLGAWDFAPNPFWYNVYAEILPRWLSWMRSRGKERTRQLVGGA